MLFLYACAHTIMDRHSPSSIENIHRHMLFFLDIRKPASYDGYRMTTRYAVRGILNGEMPEIGTLLANSWHPAESCDWLEEDQELPGSCGFACTDEDESIEVALGDLDCYWPGASAVLIAGTLVDPTEYGGLPESNGCVLANAIVIRQIR